MYDLSPFHFLLLVLLVTFFALQCKLPCVIWYVVVDFYLNVYMFIGIHKVPIKIGGLQLIIVPLIIIVQQSTIISRCGGMFKTLMQHRLK
jgi:hypothetical protein